MGRLSLLDERVRRLIASKLVPLVLQFGSVNAVCELLNDSLASKGARGRIYPNRLHALLGDDPTRAINEATLALVELAVEGVDSRSVTTGTEKAPEAIARIEQIKASWTTSRRDADSVQEVADQLQLPPAVIRQVLTQVGHIAPAAFADTISSTPSRLTGSSKVPDWSFQEIAIRRCRESFARGIGRKVGLIVPTGGGKTRIALIIALLTLKESPDALGKVIWVTHRKNLRQQAHRELQRIITEGPLPLPEDAARLLSDRIEFIMVSELEERVRQGEDILLVIVDEAHHGAAPSYQPLFVSDRPLPMLALTATPNRTDGLPIGIDEIAFHITYRELVDNGVIVMPEFEDFPVANFDWSERDIANLADFIIEEAKDRFQKTLVIAPRIARVQEFHEALVNRLASEPGHPLQVDDVGYLHSERNSLGTNPEDFLAAFAARPRAIVVSAQMLLEGFDDPQLNAVIVTYPSSSLVLLMQAAGRCVRFAVGKTKAFVVQARNDDVAYHFEQRWLYQEISDYLRPELVDVAYRDAGHLRARIQELLAERHVNDELSKRVLDDLGTVEQGQLCRLLLFGLPFNGTPGVFKQQAPWGALLETSSNSEAFRFIFNQFCSLGADLNDLETFLATAGRNHGLRQSLSGVTDWFLYSNMLVSMSFANKEVYGGSEGGALASSRPYAKNQATTWLTYVTFHYEPVVPEELDVFLRDCYNREEILGQYTPSPERWHLVVKIPVPMGEMEAHLLDDAGATSFTSLIADLRGALTDVPPSARYGAMANKLAQCEAPRVPLRVIARIDPFLSLASYGERALSLKASVAPLPHLTTSSPGLNQDQ